MTDTTRAHLMMAGIGLAFLVGANLYAGCGVPPDETATAEAALISVDPCGVQTSPYNPACTKSGKTSWVCANYNSTTHRCTKAQGTTPIPGTYFIFEPTPPPMLPLAHATIWPNWTDDTQPHTPTNNIPAMEVPNAISIGFADILASGWSYNMTDLNPHTVFDGLTGMIWDYIEIRDGTGICIYSGNNWTDQLGCWHVGAGGYFRIEPYLYGSVAVHSFSTYFYW